MNITVYVVSSFGYVRKIFFERAAAQRWINIQDDDGVYDIVEKEVK
jgi:hypothetical protein